MSELEQDNEYTKAVTSSINHHKLRFLLSSLIGVPKLWLGSDFRSIPPLWTALRGGVGLVLGVIATTGVAMGWRRFRVDASGPDCALHTPSRHFSSGVPLRDSDDTAVVGLGRSPPGHDGETSSSSPQPMNNLPQQSGSPSFSFGKNWQDYLNGVTPVHLEDAERDIDYWIGTPALRGKSVIDIGSGSGIHSSRFVKMGAARVVSLDIDVHSLEATRRMWRLFGEPSNWTVLHGSILDRKVVEDLGTFDIVYSWGVLHHTNEVISKLTWVRH